MNVGKTLFAQLMEFVPWTSFSRIVQHQGSREDAHVDTCLQIMSVSIFPIQKHRSTLTS